MTEISFDRNFDPPTGSAVPLGPHVRRITAPNASPFTFRGTNSYIVGHGTVAVIDPGPDDAGHIGALLAATAGETIAAIIITHGHRDHTDGVTRLKAASGAPVHAGSAHRPARASLAGETARLDAGADERFVPDILIADGGRIAGPGWSLEAIATPGHAADHMAFALEGSGMLFSGDHVMGWSTTVVAPPDGAMADYIASLERLAGRPETIYLPGHGAPIADAPTFVRALKSHRKLREAAILARIARGDRTIAAIVAVIYRETPAVLHGAAAMSVLAHIEDLVARGRVAIVSGSGLAAEYVAVSAD